MNVSWNGKETRYKGRNRHGRCKGVELFTLKASGFVRVSPVNNRGVTDSCYIDVPADPDILRRFAAEFVRIAGEVRR